MRYKEEIKLVSTLFTLMASIVAIREKLPATLCKVALLLLITVACLLAVSLRKPSPIKGGRTVPVFHEKFRSAAKLILALLLVLVWPLWLYGKYTDYYTPQIENITPRTPMAGDRIVISGSNFPSDIKDIEVRFNQLEAQKIYDLKKHRIELEVPQDAVPGPLYLTNRDPIPLFPFDRPMPSKPYPWLEIKPLEKTVLLISENISHTNEEVTVLFSLRNTTDSTFVTVYDILTRAMIRKPVTGGPPLGYLTGGSRDDLGTVAIFEDHPPGTAPLDVQVTSLFKGTRIETLDPKESASFRFKLLKPEAEMEYDLYVVFTVTAQYHDDQGRKRTSYSDQIYEVVLDNREGFISAKGLDWNADTLKDLMEEHSLSDLYR